MEEKLKDSSIAHENKLLADEKKHRDAVVCIISSVYVCSSTVEFIVSHEYSLINRKLVPKENFI